MRACDDIHNEMSRRRSGRTPAVTRVRDAKRREPDLDPEAPLAAAQRRVKEIGRQRQRDAYRQHMGRVAEALVALLHAANVGTPKPLPKPVYPSYVPERQVFQLPPSKAAPDWRDVLPIQDVFTRTKPAPPPPRTHGYGSPVRRNWV